MHFSHKTLAKEHKFTSTVSLHHINYQRLGRLLNLLKLFDISKY